MPVITYDLSGRHAEAKILMKTRGYLDYRLYESAKFNLPNTTLWKPDTTEKMALDDICEVANNLGVKLERAMAFADTPWWGIPGLPHG